MITIHSIYNRCSKTMSRNQKDSIHYALMNRWHNMNFTNKRPTLASYDNEDRMHQPSKQRALPIEQSSSHTNCILETRTQEKLPYCCYHTCSNTMLMIFSENNDKQQYE